MMKCFIAVIFSLFTITLFAQGPFEGTVTVIYKPDRDQTVMAEIKLKDSMIYIKQTFGGNRKFDHYVINIRKRILYCISIPAKKAILKYNLDSLTNFYERNNIKEGFKSDFKLGLSLTDKTKDINGLKCTKAQLDNDPWKITTWSTSSNIPIDQLVPFLRLIGNWNEAQIDGQMIVDATVGSKISKKESSVKVTIAKGNIAKDVFTLPANYINKDFEQLMERDRGNKNLKIFVQTFNEF